MSPVKACRPASGDDLPGATLVIFRHGFARDTATWTDAIEALVRALGGWEEVERLISRFADARCLIQLTLPIRNSPDQENDFIEAETLGRLAERGISLGMEFSEYPSADQS